MYFSAQFVPLKSPSIVDVVFQHHCMIWRMYAASQLTTTQYSREPLFSVDVVMTLVIAAAEAATPHKSRVDPSLGFMTLSERSRS